MAFLTIIPYILMPANSYHRNKRSRVKDVFKRINDHGKEPRIRSGISPVDIPQLQVTATAGGVGGLTMHEKDSDHLSLKRSKNHDSA
jgi:hypothetical protein